MTMARQHGARTAVRRGSAYLLVSMWILTPALAEDWPEWRGAGRRGKWNETGILESFPAKGLTVAWRTPVRGGVAGPAVSAGGGGGGGRYTRGGGGGGGGGRLSPPGERGKNILSGGGGG